MTEFERMRAGKIYNPNEPEEVRKRTRARWLVDKFNKTKAWNLIRRTYLIKRLVPNAGKNFFFEPNIRMEYGENITFGDNFYMNFDCRLLDCATITIGNDVMFGPGVTLATPRHPFVADERAFKHYADGYHDLEYASPITIGDNVWIASNVTVCGGVNIGSDTIIAAGSVVTRDIPSGVIAAGVPCRVLREITDADRINPLERYRAGE